MRSSPSQQRGTPAAESGQSGNLLGERPARTAGHVVEKSSHSQVHDELLVTGGTVHDPPLIAAVYPFGVDPAARTRGRCGAASSIHLHRPASGRETVDQQTGELRKHGADQVGRENPL